MTNNIKIIVKTLNNAILTFTVDKYSIEDGHIKFLDQKTNIIKSYPVSNCEINEVKL